MNLFGVLKYKKMGEDFVINSGLPYTIIRFVARIVIAFNHIIIKFKTRTYAHYELTTGDIILQC